MFKYCLFLPGAKKLFELVTERALNIIKRQACQAPAEEDSFPRSLWQCRYKIWKQTGIMTFVSSWTRLQGSWFHSSVCVTCSWSIGNAITAVRLMQRYRLLRGQCNSEVGRYIKKHCPKFNLPVALHLFLLIFLPLINKRNRVPSSIKGPAGPLGRLDHCLEPWACTATFHWAKESSHKSTRALLETTDTLLSAYSMGGGSVPMASPNDLSAGGEPTPALVQHHGQRQGSAIRGTRQPRTHPAATQNTPRQGLGRQNGRLTHQLLLLVFFATVEGCCG